MKKELTKKEQVDELESVIYDLDNMLDEYEDKSIIEEIRNLKYYFEDKLDNLKIDLAAIEKKEYQDELSEREREYREVQGF